MRPRVIVKRRVGFGASWFTTREHQKNTYFEKLSLKSEENVWKLCDFVRKGEVENLEKLFVVFISNERRAIPLWKQKASQSTDEPVIWDYHVILVLKEQGQEGQVFDLDTLLSFPCQFSDYSLATFRSDEMLLPQYHRMFRVIPAKVFIETFASDRSHMKKDGEWQSPPPTYPCIETEASKMNLDDFINMNRDVGQGEVINLEDLNSKFA
ncbi:protein N-terminal glutamine amidohydrolase-like isoform X2 [Glandiceps talaboti]